MTVRDALRRIDRVFLAILLAQTISFAPGHLHLPLRGENHGALPACVVKASGAIFGATPLGYRSIHVLLGLCTIVLVYLARRVTYGSTQQVAQTTYGSHLQRVGGIGLSPYPSMFYARGPIQSLHVQITGRELRDETPEYPSVNAGLGLLLLGAVLVTTFRASGRDDLGRFLLLAFWIVFGFFTLIRPGSPPGRLDPVSWIWVEATLLPAVVLAGARLADAAGRARAAGWALAAGALLYASAAPLAGLLGHGTRIAEEAMAAASHAVQTVAIETVAIVRIHPLRAVALALAAGALAGALLGFGCRWIARSRRGRDYDSS